MKQKYSIEWLQQKFDAGESVKPIYFWGHANKFNEQIGKFCFSQWYVCPFTVAGVTYQTAEHWMMARKALLFGDKENYNEVIASATPGAAKDLGRRTLGFDENIWVKHRYEIVVEGNIHKFNQHPVIAKYLLETNDRVIVEASPVDAIWGIGLSQDSDHIDNIYNWRGLNLLGFALMEARDFLRGFGHFEPLQNAVLPPWMAHPNIHSIDMFWRMGMGEGYIMEFYTYYSQLNERDKTIYRLTHPAPTDWENFYE